MKTETSSIRAASWRNAASLEATARGGSRPWDPARWLEIIAALASTLAVTLVAALSFGAYGLAVLLKRVPFLRKAHKFLSAAYDRFLDQLGQKVLADPRDVPALRLMVSLTLTAVPVFLAQLAIGELQPLLVVAFYLSLYGLKFNRFVRMFSAKHLEAHRRHGFFSETYSRVFGRYVEFFLGYLYGNVPELDRTAHVCLHHREHSGAADTMYTGDYDRTSRLDFFRFLGKNLWNAMGIYAYIYFNTRAMKKYSRRMMWGIVRYYLYFVAIFCYNWKLGVWFVLVPFLCMNFIGAIIAWVQHAFHDPEQHPKDYFTHTVTVLDTLNFMNEGYHLGHHHSVGLHWTEMPAHFETIREKMKAAGSFVFRDLDFMDLFFEMTLLRRMDVLAQKLIPWEPLSHEQKLALLTSRTKPV